MFFFDTKNCYLKRVILTHASDMKALLLLSAVCPYCNKSLHTRGMKKYWETIRSRKAYDSLTHNLIREISEWTDIYHLIQAESLVCSLRLCVHAFMCLLKYGNSVAPWAAHIQHAFPPTFSLFLFLCPFSLSVSSSSCFSVSLCLSLSHIHTLSAYSMEMNYLLDLCT